MSEEGPFDRLIQVWLSSKFSLLVALPHRSVYFSGGVLEYSHTRMHQSGCAKLNHFNITAENLFSKALHGLTLDPNLNMLVEDSLL